LLLPSALACSPVAVSCLHALVRLTTAVATMAGLDMEDRMAVAAMTTGDPDVRLTRMSPITVGLGTDRTCTVPTAAAPTT
jgi:hypothetical protein